jgi:cation diffusion facilitator CzcD-associated flavoprotein CzcO
VSHTEHFNVLIVGAGISGIDAAYHLQTHCIDKRFTLLETQVTFGGTWSTHKYPGIRSDSDLFTFGFGWKPWTGIPIATGEEILKYLDEAIDEQDLRKHIRFQHTVTTAAWSSEDALWTVDVSRAASRDKVSYTANFLWMCQGYYVHSQPHTPEFSDMDRFTGQIVHPQAWPEDLDYKNKKVVVIGSGATAATLIPAMADDTAHITMLQRSPTYFFAAPVKNALQETLRQLELPEEWIHEIMRRKMLFDSEELTRRSFDDAEALKAELISDARAYLGDEFDIDKHFTPSYRPWRQRLALIPDGDLYHAIHDGKASVVTDQIESFTEAGIKLESGTTLEADIVVTATGFNLCVLGDIAFIIDDKPLNFADTCTYRGMMYSGVPNMAWVFGYLRSSWTLRADLISQFVCRLLNHMEEKDVAFVTPTLSEQDKDMPLRPFIEPDNFNAGYLMRSMHLLPKQGDRIPWLMSQDYYLEKDEIPVCDLDDGTLRYTAIDSTICE